ncbi:hypothetical protein [Ignatzschineria sp. LJL83]
MLAVFEQLHARNKRLFERLTKGFSEFRGSFKFKSDVILFRLKALKGLILLVRDIEKNANIRSSHESALIA